MQDRGVKPPPPEDVLACSRTLIERRLKPHNDQVLKCPRCDSLNTKFCYYNNYSLLQPRHFCKSCRRYWTKGGALRNVPVGGGCRKNKRTKQRLSEQQSSATQQNEHPVNMGSEGPPLPDTMAGASASSLYYALPNSSRCMEGDDMSFPFGRAHHQQVQLPPPSLRLAEQSGLATSTSGLFGVQATSHLASLPPSTLASLSNHLSNLGALPLRNAFMGLDFSAALRPEHGNLGPPGHLNAFLETHPHLSAVSHAPASTVTNNERAGAFSLGPDSFHAIDQDGHWKAQQQHKLTLHTDHDGHTGQPQGLIPFENHSMERLRHSQIRQGLTNLSPCMKVEDSRPADWQPGQEGFYEAATEGNYWNNGAWPDLSGYPSASSLL